MLNRVALLKVGLIIFLFNPFTAAASDFKGARELFANIDTKDAFMVAQITHRCAGLFGAATRFMPQGNKKGTADISSKFLEKTFFLLIRGREGAEEKIGEKLLKDSRYYISVYEKQMDLSQRNTGTIFSDWVGAEMDFCTLFAKKVF